VHVQRWGSGPNVVVGLHGITATSESWKPVARRLGEEWTLVAPDLRGRGRSAGVGPPYGLTQHADDVAALVESTGASPVVVAGQSMGAYVAVVAAARHPSLCSRLVLVDGGLPLPSPPAGTDPDAVLDATLGPAIARLRRTFASVDEYLDFWRAHPALGPTWNPDVEDYVRYDLVGEPPELRSSAREDAVRADGRELLVGAATIGDALHAIACPIRHLRAERGLMDEPSPLQPEALAASWEAELPDFTSELVPDTSHYSIAFGDHGAEAIARAIQARE
jgi:pimeloyl-ACP methyl ester carboxylesterase